MRPLIHEFTRRVNSGIRALVCSVERAHEQGRGRRAISVIILGGALLLSSTGVGLAQTVDTTLWVTNGQVLSIAHDGARIYIGGAFTYVGPATGAAAAIDASTAAVRQPYPRVAGYVYAVAPDGSGGWYLGGNFKTVRGQLRSNLAHIDAGGNLTSWNPGANATVTALALSGGTVYVAGQFSVIGGQPRNLIAAVDAASGTVTAWSPNASGPTYHNEPTVHALAVSGGTVYAGGNFDHIGGQPRNNIAALDTTTGAATAWNPNANFFIWDIRSSGGTVYACGDFSSIGGQPRNRIAALDATTGAATAWNPNANNTVAVMAVTGGTVYAAGYFTTMGGQPRNHLAALDAATGVTTTWDPNANGTVYGLAESGGTIYAGGPFTSIGGQPRNNLAALDAASGAATSWNPNPGGSFSPYGTGVRVLAVSGGTVYAGGEFNSVGGVPRYHIAALDEATGVATAWDPNANSGVTALAVSGGVVYAGGQFTSIGGQPRNRITALDAATGAATAWDPNADNIVRTLVSSAGGVYAGGLFTSIGGLPRNRIALLDATTGAATAWDPNADNEVDCLALNGGTVYAGGYFTSIGGLLRNRIAALDAATGAATAWDPNANSGVFALAVGGGTIYAGGTFSSMGGPTHYRIAAIDAATGAISAWSPMTEAANDVHALAVSGNTLYAGAGFLNTVGGQPRNAIVAFDATTGAVTAWNPNMDSEVDALAVSGGRVYAGGLFTGVGGIQAGVAAISEGYLLSVGGDRSVAEGSLTMAPNPTWAGTQIQYAVARAGHVRLELVDVSGRVEATLADGFQTSGRHVVDWDGVSRRGRPSPGVYFLRLVTPSQVTTRKLAIIR